MELNANDKAEELVQLFKNSQDEDGFNDVRDIYAAKRCALICVNEMLNALYSVQNRDKVGFEYLKDIVDGYELSDFFEQIQNDLTNP